MPAEPQPATTSGLAAALVAFQDEGATVPKDGKNPHFKSQFPTLDSALAKLLPLLSKHGLAIAQFPTYVEGAQPALCTKLLHRSGESIEATMLLLPAKNDPQGQGAAITYARRYSLLAILGIGTGDDDDGNTASGKAVTPEPKFAAPANPPAPGGASSAQHAKLNAILNELKAADASYDWLQQARSICRDKFKKLSRADLTTAEMSQLIDEMQGSLEAMREAGSAVLPGGVIVT